MNTWSDGVVESRSVGSIRLKATLLYSNIPIPRLRLCLTLCAMLFALCLPAHAQQAGKIFRIGFLDNSTASGNAPLLDAFRQELRKLGWIEGKNFTFEYRFA